MEEATVGETPEETWREQVRAVAEELPFDDDPSGFVVTLEALAEAHALADEARDDAA